MTEETPVSRTRSLKTIQTLADTAEAESSKEVSQRLAALNKEEHRLQQLVEYLADYEAKERMDRQGQSIAAIRSRRQFIERLHAAINQQKQLVDNYRLLYDNEARRWREARSHSLGLRKYADRIDRQEELKQARRDQSRLDEIGSRSPGR